MDNDIHDPGDDAISRIPIPHLQEDLSNYDAWQHALYFHLRYHGLFYFLLGHEQSRWELRMNDDDNAAPTNHDRVNYRRRSMHAYSILFSRIGNIVPRLFAAGWDGERDSFAFRTDLLWIKIQELRRDIRHDVHMEQDHLEVPEPPHLRNQRHRSRAIDLTDAE
ncbi:hypothetical protein B0H65DRAFT_521010 [Neurospora tetraspora]|uniref:Uncharacterized protein n=1 Tax=Neurospora tetraspora TaxID=94610 RepID=A0AAE0MUZ6_9PEZI|nr:hypothetical protein B0H65DRAFT_521010 [Neurospora tetraspora]